jgi:carbon storage regulator
MIILTRLPGQRIMIGDDIVITVLRRKGGEIVLGISAPRAISVDREEVRKRKVADKVLPPHASMLMRRQAE